MIQTVYTNGCSWTAGNELENSPEFLKFIRRHRWHLQDSTDPLNWNLLDRKNKLICTVDQHYDKFNWPGQLQQLLSANNLVNQAAGGGSNDRILRTTTEYVKSLPANKRHSTLILIGWTIADRSELLADQHWQRFNSAQPFSHTVDRLYLTDNKRILQYDQYQQHYINTVLNDRQRVHNYFQTIYLLSNLLDNLGIPYYFFNALPAWWSAGADQVSFDVVSEFSTDISWLESHNNIHSRHDTMFGYVYQQSLPTAPWGHPLATAHQHWASHLYNHLLLRNIV